MATVKIDPKEGVSKYIVELFRWDTHKHVYEKKDDCIMILNTNSGLFEILPKDNFTMTKNVTNGLVNIIQSDKSTKPSYIKANINKDNVCIISREAHKIASLHNVSRIVEDSKDVGIGEIVRSPEITIDYEMTINGNKFGIRFDSRSNASERNFFMEYSKLKTKYQSAEFYQSGNIKIEGMKTQDGFTGTCVEYYDSKTQSIKYVGEFEDGIYDGEGEFFSIDGNIRLSCKNICGGKPNGVGRLVVGKNYASKIVQMKDVHDIPTKTDDYAKKVYAKIEPNYEEILDTLAFIELSLEERILFLFKELRKLKSSGHVGNVDRVDRADRVDRVGTLFGLM
jgi:hypothetical protein